MTFDLLQIKGGFLSSQASYRNLLPLEQGGIYARKGFSFQDHAAAGFFLDLILDANLTEVWCETLDDITLIWDDNGREIFEFVQAKSTDEGRFWSLASLKKREKSKKNGKSEPKVGSSILEKSLANHRSTEQTRFRMVTAVDIQIGLRILKSPLDSPERNVLSEDWKDLENKLLEDLGDFKSSQGTDCCFWLRNTIWQVNQSIDNLTNGNHLKIYRICQKLNQHLMDDQIAELYKKIVSKAREAAEADNISGNHETKRICKASFLMWFEEEVVSRISRASGEGVEEKLSNAELSDLVDTANDFRMRYRRRQLESQYMEGNYEDLEDKLRGQLNRLLTECDNSQEFPNGRVFYQMCLSKIDTICSEAVPSPDWLDTYLQGFMFELADRCVLRFTKVTT